MDQNLHQSLREIFGFEEFRAMQQDAVCAAQEGRDVLVVMPTGAGKSLCYQLPAANCPGVTLVVSPLVALMRDQVVALQQRTTFAQLGAASLSSLQSSSEQYEVLDRLREGSLKLLYVAPERFASSAFMEVLQSVGVARFVVDEAHCISQWGHDFRPDYLSLKNVVAALGHPPLTAATATATQRVQNSIVANLGMRDPAIFIGGFDRPNLHFSVVRCLNDTDRNDRLARALPRLAARGGSGLIYVATRKQCAQIAALASQTLAPMGLKAAAYHAGLPVEHRNAVQSDWLNGQLHLLVATNAFGMGIDKPDVRYVVHYVHPESPEAYYQEAGRAGRDGHKSRCVILYHFADKRLREFFIENDALDLPMMRRAHAALCARAGQSTQSQRGAEALAVPKAWWKMALDHNDNVARAIIGKLDHFGLIERVSENSETSILKIAQTKIDANTAQEIERHLNQEQSERRSRLGEMISYCKAGACRRKAMLEYFGDEHDAAQRDYCCDVCDNPQKFTARQTSQLPQDVKAMSTSETDIHGLLQNLDGIRPRVGKTKLNSILRAAKIKGIERFEKHPLHGALRGATCKSVDDFLEHLKSNGIMAQADEDEYFVWYVTEKGRHAWQGKTPVEVVLPFSTPTQQSIEDDEPGAELFEKLRSWRRQLATSEKLPPYCILSDKTLRAIVAIKPVDEDALAQVPGIGASKLEKYGAGILAVVSG